MSDPFECGANVIMIFDVEPAQLLGELLFMKLEGPRIMLKNRQSWGKTLKLTILGLNVNKTDIELKTFYCYITINVAKKRGWVVVG